MASETQPLHVRTVRPLIMNRAPSPGRTTTLTAASALVKVGQSFYVAPDDEQHIARFPVDGKTPGRWARAFSGTLPADTAARKKVKPDFESLVRLPPVGRAAEGAVLALASGSTTGRERAALWALEKDGALKGRPREVSLSPLYATLRKTLPELNIEGSAVTGDTLRLLQRGNAGTGPNAIIDLDLPKVLAQLEAKLPLDGTLIRSIRLVQLGKAGTTPLTFSDASPLPDGRIVFSAIAEDTVSTFEDGEFKGSAIGVMSPEGEVVSLRRVSGHKIEGVHAEHEGNHLRLWMVSDADDPTIPSPLLTARMA